MIWVIYSQHFTPEGRHSSLFPIIKYLGKFSPSMTGNVIEHLVLPVLWPKMTPMVYELIGFSVDPYPDQKPFSLGCIFLSQVLSFEDGYCDDITHHPDLVSINAMFSWSFIRTENLAGQCLFSSGSFVSFISSACWTFSELPSSSSPKLLDVRISSSWCYNMLMNWSSSCLSSWLSSASSLW